MASAGEVTEAVGVTTTEVATNGAQMVTSGVTGSGRFHLDEDLIVNLKH